MEVLTEQPIQTEQLPSPTPSSAPPPPPPSRAPPLSMRALYEMARAQEQYIKRLGLDPNQASDIDIIIRKEVKENEETKEEVCDCSLCLCPIEDEDPYLPCNCLYFKVHIDCLPVHTITCQRCRVSYRKSMANPLNEENTQHPNFGLPYRIGTSVQCAGRVGNRQCKNRTTTGTMCHRHRN